MGTILQVVTTYTICAGSTAWKSNNNDENRWIDKTPDSIASSCCFYSVDQNQN